MRKTAILMLALVALLAAACGGGGETLADGDEVTISLSEFEFQPSELRLTPGTTVTIRLENTGEKDHEFMAGQEVHFEDDIPHGFESDFFETVEGLSVDPPDALSSSMEGMDMKDESMTGTTMGDMEGDEEHADDEDHAEDDEHMDMDMGFMVVREPAQTATITFTVTEASIGEWQIGCFEEDGAHWDDGMQGTIIVEEV